MDGNMNGDGPAPRSYKPTITSGITPCRLRLEWCARALARSISTWAQPVCVVGVRGPGGMPKNPIRGGFPWHSQHMWLPSAKRERKGQYST
jgi:hypothetical protein